MGLGLTQKHLIKKRILTNGLFEIETKHITHDQIPEKSELNSNILIMTIYSAPWIDTIVYSCNGVICIKKTKKYVFF